LSPITELSRRNVWRAAAAYIVTAWLIIQVVETTFPAFGVGASAVRTVITVLAIGFIPAMVLAWVFEWTPEGLRRESAVAERPPSALAMAKRTDRMIMIILAFGLAFFAVDKFVLDPARDESRAQEAARQARSDALSESFGDRSIAVLPFVNISADPENEYFSDGISEELLNLLARIPDLRVISRSSSFSFKGKDISMPEVAAELSVAFVLEGSVRKAGERLRITAQLIEARSDTHLWSETYDRTLDDVFAIQDEISAAIVEQLKPRMGLAIQFAPRTPVTPSPVAHEAYLRGRYLFEQRSIESAIEAFEEAVRADPAFAPAQAGLALAYRFTTLYLDAPKNEAVDKARPHAQRALQLDPNLAEAHAAMGYVLVDTETMDQAISHFRRAIELNPNYADAHLWLAGFLDIKGQPHEAAELYQRALQLDPLSLPIRANVIDSLMARDRLQEADKELERLKTLDPGWYRLMMIQRKSVGGNWADGALAALSAWSSDADHDAVHELPPLLAILQFPEESWPETGKPSIQAFRVSGQSSRIVELGAADEASVGPFAFALALAGAGEFGRAHPLLENLWDKAEQQLHRDWFTAYHAVALYVSRLQTGSAGSSADLLESINKNVETTAEAGIVGGGVFWDADFEAGMAEWLNGQSTRALERFRQAVDRGYFVYPNEAYLRDLYDLPGFAPIMDVQRQRQRDERLKFLSVICKENPHAEIWSPPKNACHLQ